MATQTRIPAAPVRATITDWGAFRIYIDDVDVTYLAGPDGGPVPTVVESYAIEEPFGESTASLHFPGIDSRQVYGGLYPDFVSGDPSLHWLRDWAPVEILVERPDHGTVSLWEGNISSWTDEMTDAGTSQVSVECTGWMHQINVQLRQPAFTDNLVDIGVLIWNFFFEAVFGYRYGGKTLMGGLWEGAKQQYTKPEDWTKTPIGIYVRDSGGWEALLTGNIDAMLKVAWYGGDDTHEANQWTLMPNRRDVVTAGVHSIVQGRQPELRLKDVSSIAVTLVCGQPGVSHSLKRDLTQAVRALYGEGVDDAPTHCHWRNSVYPVDWFVGVDPPLWTRVLEYGMSGADVLNWGTRMAQMGRMEQADDFFGYDDKDAARQLQVDMGLPVTYEVDAATWAAAFFTSDTLPYRGGGSDWHIPYIAPLYEDPPAAPMLRRADGTAYARNPNYVDRYRYVERYNNYGTYTSKADALKAAKLEVLRDKDGDYAGTITLKVDPPEMSRFEIRPGMNVLYKDFASYRAYTSTPNPAGNPWDSVFHIAKVDADPQGGQVTLTVDQKGRDFKSIVAIRERWKEISDPSKRPVPARRNSHLVQDIVPEWDCESGAGNIPRHAIQAGVWQVLRIPAAMAGTVARTEFHTDTPCRFSIGIFDAPTTPTYVANQIGPQGPLEDYSTPGSGNQASIDPWDLFNDDPISGGGLIIAWGGKNAAAGFSPQTEGEGRPPTGALIDNANWYYESKQAPWLWVAEWCEITTNIRGHLFPAATFF